MSNNGSTSRFGFVILPYRLEFINLQVFGGLNAFFAAMTFIVSFTSNSVVINCFQVIFLPIRWFFIPKIAIGVSSLPSPHVANISSHSACQHCILRFLSHPVHFDCLWNAHTYRWSGSVSGNQSSANIPHIPIADGTLSIIRRLPIGHSRRIQTEIYIHVRKEVWIGVIKGRSVIQEIGIAGIVITLLLVLYSGTACYITLLAFLKVGEKRWARTFRNRIWRELYRTHSISPIEDEIKVPVRTATYDHSTLTGGYGPLQVYRPVIIMEKGPPVYGTSPAPYVDW